MSLSKVKISHLILSQTKKLHFQNKCVRYWAEDGQTREIDALSGKFFLKHLSSSSTADYTLREFELEKEGVVSGYHCFFES